MTTANSTRNGNGEDQLFRRAFDTFYEFDAVGTATEAAERLRRVKRRTRWIAVTIVAASVLGSILMVFLNAGVEEVKEAQMPTIAERLAAPYDLALQPANLAVQAGMPDLPGYHYNNLGFEGLNPVLRCMLAPVDCTLSFGNVPVAMPVVDTTETNPELLAEAEAIAAAAMDAAMEASTEVDEYGNRIPAVFTEDLMKFTDVTGIIAGHYFNDDTEVKITVAQFINHTEARNAAVTMFDYARSVGGVGDHVLGVSQPMGYFYSSTGGWINFVWFDAKTVYSVSTHSWRDLDDVIAKLQALPPVPVMDNLSTS